MLINMSIYSKMVFSQVWIFLTLFLKLGISKEGPLQSVNVKNLSFHLEINNAQQFLMFGIVYYPFLRTNYDRPSHKIYISYSKKRN